MGQAQGPLTLNEDLGLRLCVWDLVAEVCSMDLLSLYTILAQLLWVQCVNGHSFVDSDSFRLDGVEERARWANKRTDRQTAGQQGPALGIA